jgi:hypothetical protein
MNVRTWYLSISKDSDGYHTLHKNTCHLASPSEEMILIGPYELEVIALEVASNNFGKVRPCISCIQHYASHKNEIVPSNSMQR